MSKPRYLVRTSILFFLLLNAGWISSIHAQNGWEPMPPMPTSRGVFKSVVHNGKIYAVGGIKSVKPPYGICNEVYDIETGAWSVMAPMDQPRSGLTVEVLNDKIYVVGGVYATNQQETNILEYDIVTDTWITKCTMPEPRFNHISEVLDGKIYIAGGLTIDETGNHPGLTSSLVYDPENDNWDTIADLNHERFFGRSCVFNDKIYVFGGAPSGVPYRTAHQSIEIYDPETDVWVISEDEIPIPFMGGMVQVYGDSILIFGGFEIVLNEECYHNTYMYVPGYKDDNWTVMASMPVDRGIMSGNNIDDHLYMIGGMNGVKNGELMVAPDNHWRFDLDSLKPWNGPCSETKISDTQALLEVDSTHILSLQVLPSYLPVRSVSWASSLEDVATVTSEGMFTGVSPGTTIITGIADSSGCSVSHSIQVVEHVPEVMVKVVDSYTGEILADYNLYLDGKKFETDPDAKVILTGWVFDSCSIQITKNDYMDYDATVVVTCDTTLLIRMTYAHPEAELELHSESLFEKADYLKVTMNQHGTIYITPEGTPAHVDSIAKYAIHTIPAYEGRTVGTSLGNIPPGIYRIYGISQLGRMAVDAYLIQVIDHFPECSIQVRDALSNDPIDSCLMVVNGQDSIADSSGKFDLTGLVYDSCSLEVSREGYYGFDTTLIVLTDTSYVINLVPMGTGLAEIPMQEISLYPNPTSDFITVQTREQGSFILELISLEGCLMKKMDLRNNLVQVDLSSYQSGIYLIRLVSKDKVSMGRVLKY